MVLPVLQYLAVSSASDFLLQLHQSIFATIFYLGTAGATTFGSIASPCHHYTDMSLRHSQKIIFPLIPMLLKYVN